MKTFSNVLHGNSLKESNEGQMVFDLQKMENKIIPTTVKTTISTEIFDTLKGYIGIRFSVWVSRKP